MWLRFGILPVTLAFVLFALPVTANSRLDRFIETYQALEGRSVAVGQPDNPFRPYHGIFLENGLDDRSRAALETALRAGDCLRVNALMIDGFLNLYPHLRAAFDDPAIRRDLEFRLIAEFKPLASGRCVAHSRLRKLISRRNLTDFLVFDLSAEITAPYASHHAGDADKDELINILFSLGRMAFCNDYPPALRDVWATLNRSGGMRVSAEEELYLVERIHVYGLPEDAYRNEMARISKLFSDQEYFTEVQAAARRYRLSEKSIFSGFWQRACTELAEAGHIR